MTSDTFSPQKHAVITGASRGLGKSFAEEIIKRGISPILISSSEQVNILADSLQEKYHIPCHAFRTDLTKPDQILATVREINENYDVFLLINNAGTGGSQRFDSADINRLEKIIQLNVTAPMLMCKLLLPNLLKQNKSYILNVSSMAALTPVGYKMDYPASKAFLRHFSFDLREEFRHTGLSVSVVCPGAMATSPEITQRIENQGFFGKLTLVSTENVAKKCVRQTLKGKKEIIVNPVSFLFSHIVPRCISSPLLTRIVKRETENHE